MSEKEPPLMQQLGRKKYKEQVEKCNKFYDDHMAGKRNPKTGDYYYPISYSDPSKPKFGNLRARPEETLGYITCRNKNCNQPVRVSGVSRGITCWCGEAYIWTDDDKAEAIANTKKLQESE
jgi:hypothetical protein